MDYMFVTYKPTSDDFCMGCHMATYSSDYEISYELTEDALIERWGHFLFLNMNLDCNEVGYDFWVFRNGLPVPDDVPALYKKALVIANEKQADKTRREAEATATAKARKAEYDKGQRQETYEKLKKEFSE